jgi:hypothetical protein
LIASAALLVAAPTANAADPMTLTTPNGALPAATLGTAYSVGITALGGVTQPVRWNISAGSLPSGLSITTDGAGSSTKITGTPTATGVYSFSLRARDKSGNSVTGSFSITVNGAAVVNGAGALTVTNQGSVLVRGETGRSYATTLFASGGQQPYVWSIVSGTLPAGLQLSGNQISGKPSTAGTSTFTAQVADASGQTATKLFSIVIF